MELEALEEVHSKIKAEGAALLMISPQTGEQSQIFVKEKNLTVELLSDPDNRIAEKYGIAYTFPEDLKQVYLEMGINLEEYNGNASWRLPLVARYIIDQEGIIQYSFVSVDHTDRADTEDTLDVLKKLRGDKQ
ncbi:MAG: redoxin domain-containing protein [Desulforhopalus sp.]